MRVAHSLQLCHVSAYLTLMFLVGAGKLEVDDYHAIAIAHHSVGACGLDSSGIISMDDGALIEQLVLAGEPLGGLR